MFFVLFILLAKRRRGQKQQIVVKSSAKKCTVRIFFLNEIPGMTWLTAYCIAFSDLTKENRKLYFP